MAATVMFLLFLLPFADALIANASQGQQYGSSLSLHRGNQNPPYQGQPFYRYLQLVIQNPRSVDQLTPVTHPHYPYFTIHGLWPTSYRSVENCSFGDYTLPETLEQELDLYWPNAHSYRRSSRYGVRQHNEIFRESEYQKHGSCANLIFGSAENYFRTALGWYHWAMYNVPVLSVIQPGDKVFTRKFYTSRFFTSVQRAIGADPLLLCNTKEKRPDQLKEVVICLDERATTVIPCSRTAGQSCPWNGLIYL